MHLLCSHYVCCTTFSTECRGYLGCARHNCLESLRHWPPQILIRCRDNSFCAPSQTLDSVYGGALLHKHAEWYPRSQQEDNIDRESILQHFASTVLGELASYTMYNFVQLAMWTTAVGNKMTPVLSNTIVFMNNNSEELDPLGALTQSICTQKNIYCSRVVSSGHGRSSSSTQNTTAPDWSCTAYPEISQWQTRHCGGNLLPFAQRTHSVANVQYNMDTAYFFRHQYREQSQVQSATPVLEVWCCLFKDHIHIQKLEPQVVFNYPNN